LEVKALKNGEEKNQILKVRNEGEEKMNWTGGHLNLYGSFTDGLPTASPTDIKLIIILIYFIGDLLKIRR
jgi:hypothetical protein